MLVIKIELHSAIDHRVEEIGRAYIANDGTGTTKKSSYDVAICRKGIIGIPENLGGFEAPARTGRVLDYPRTSYNVWRLISRAVLAAFPEEQKTRPDKFKTTITPQVLQGLTEIAEMIKSGLAGDHSPDVAAALEWINAGVDELNE